MDNNQTNSGHLKIQNCIQAFTAGVLLTTAFILGWTAYIENKTFKTTKDHQVCEVKRERYFDVYRHFKEDIKDQEQGIYSYNEVNDKKIKEGVRIAQNAIRHFSFSNDTPYLIIKALDATFSNNEPKDTTPLEHYFQRGPDKLSLEQERKQLLKNVLKGLNDSRWPTFEKYENQRQNDNCF